MQDDGGIDLTACLLDPGATAEHAGIAGHDAGVGADVRSDQVCADIAAADIFG